MTDPREHAIDVALEALYGDLAETKHHFRAFVAKAVDALIPDGWGPQTTFEDQS